MKKYIFLGGLIGFILGVLLFVSLIPIPGIMYLSGGFLTGQFFLNLPTLSGDTAIILNIIFSIIVPTLFYAFIGYIIGMLVNKKSHIS